MEVAQISKVRMSRYMDTSSTTQVAKIMVKLLRPSCFSRANFARSPTCRPIVGKTVRGSSIGIWMKRSAELGMYVRSSKTRIILIGHVDDIKMAGKKQHLAPTRKKLMENVDLDEPTSFLDHENLGCTQRECKPKEVSIEE